MPKVTFEDFTPTERVPIDPAILDVLSRLNKDRSKVAHFELASEDERKKTIRMFRRAAEQENLTVRITPDEDGWDIRVRASDRQTRTRKAK